MIIRDTYTFAGKHIIPYQRSFFGDTEKLFIVRVYFKNAFHLFFSSSDAKNMATDVRNILLNIIKTKGNMDDASALQYLKKMEAQKRYSADVWS